jgi:hypothetical protein
MRALLAALLLAMSLPAAAEWVMITKNDSVTYYLDPDTVRKNGNMRRVWVLNNLKQRHKDGEMSRRSLREIDCKEEKSRILSLSTHSEPMVGGKTLVLENSPTEWGFIPPNSTNAHVFEFVCSK